MSDLIEEITLDILNVYKLEKYNCKDLEDMPVSAGIYFLFSYDAYKLVYIGQSKHLKFRLRSHDKGIIRNKKNSYLHRFSHYSYIELKDICLRKLYEMAYICHYKPVLNSDGCK
jgi:excinuclease UvrABC nuclease subunit